MVLRVVQAAEAAVIMADTQAQLDKAHQEAEVTMAAVGLEVVVVVQQMAALTLVIIAVGRVAAVLLHRLLALL